MSEEQAQQLMQQMQMLETYFSDLSKREETFLNVLQEATAAVTSIKSLGQKSESNTLVPIGMGTYAVAAFEKITRMTFPLGANNLIFVSLGSDQVRTDLHAGGQKQIVEHVLNILSGDPTKA